MNFVLIDESTTSSPLKPQLTVEWLKKCAAAVAVQLNRDFAAEWGGNYSVRVAESAQDIAKGEVAFVILDDLPQAPDAIAYHDVGGNAVPVAFLALRTCATLDDVSTAISHECVEAGADPECNYWVDDGQGREVALETADPVETRTYAIDGIAVSDFVLRKFFAPANDGPYTAMGSMGSADVARPFALSPGGYLITRTASGDISQVTGQIRGHRVAHKAHWSSRTFRRGARVAA